MIKTVIKVENLSKQYRLGSVGTGTLSHDLNRFWARLRGKEDPYIKIGEVNDRTKKSASKYVWALKDINFEMNAGDVLGIIGRNGAGKSTLLKILSQVTSPTTGSVRMNGRVGSLLEVGTGFHPELTGRENIFINGAILGMSRREINLRLDEIVDFAGVEKYLDTPVKRYSSGMKVRLGFAVAAHLEPEILIVDEVLAVGDYLFQKKCLGKLGEVGKEGRSIIFVSHNLSVLSNLCTRAIAIDKGIIVDDGKTSDVVANYLKDESSLDGQIEIVRNSIYRAQVLSAILKNDRNEFTDTLNLGGKGYIYLKVLFSQESMGVHIALILYDSMNNHIVSLADTDTDLNKFTLRRMGEFTYRVLIPSEILNEGRYHLFCGIGVPGQDVLFRQELFSFYISSRAVGDLVIEGGKRAGILNWKTRWEEIG
jgi:lipopolysaccharide transport system ATP-binding protein